MHKGIIEKYRIFLPVTARTPVVTLLEGNTPLIRANNIEQLLKFEGEIYLKYEGMNPTGSFKDRGMTLAISKAVEEKSKVVICASTGNTSASAAAYAARANIRCIVLIPSGSIALGKLSQALIHGAEVFAVRGNFDEALKIVKGLSEKYPITMVNSLNPYRIEGQKTAAFEIIETLGCAPTHQFMPVGNAGNITAYWKGYKESCFTGFKFGDNSLEFRGQRRGDRGQRTENRGQRREKRKEKREKTHLSSLISHPSTLNSQLSTRGNLLPRMFGFQAAGAAPIVLGRPVEKPKTIATAIKIGNPASWKSAIAARDESKGVIDSVTDDEILDAYKLLANSEGVFCEPASAASIAGLIKYTRKGFFTESLHRSSAPSPIVVCILTGHGLKDPDCVVKNVKKPKVVECKTEKIAKMIGF